MTDQSASAIASHLRLDLYCVNPAARGWVSLNYPNDKVVDVTSMDDGKLHKLFRNATAGNLILIEDMSVGSKVRNQYRTLT